MDAGTLLVGLALLIVVAFVVARPIVDGRVVREHDLTPEEQLVAERERVL